MLSLAKGEYFLGNSLLDSGQRHIPEAPERIVGTIFILNLITR